MREPDEYKKWHIRDSISFYYVLLNQDKIIPELFRFVLIISHSPLLIEINAEQNDRSVCE